MNDRQTLQKKLDEVSFCVNDLTLYLDTHPTDEQALQLFTQYMEQRKQLLKEYEAKFEPLMVDCVRTEDTHPHNERCHYAGQKHFTWVDGPAPWEGGNI